MPIPVLLTISIAVLRVMRRSSCLRGTPVQCGFTGGENSGCFFISSQYRNGYVITLHISNGSPEIEEKLLSRMQQQRIDGAVIITCMPDKTDDQANNTYSEFCLWFR
jgi:hypothetical protein